MLSGLTINNNIMQQFDINSIVGGSLVSAIKILCIGPIVKNRTSSYNIDGIDRIIWYHLDDKTISIGRFSIINALSS